MPIERDLEFARYDLKHATYQIQQAREAALALKALTVDASERDCAIAVWEGLGQAATERGRGLAIEVGELTLAKVEEEAAARAVPDGHAELTAVLTRDELIVLLHVLPETADQDSMFYLKDTTDALGRTVKDPARAVAGLRAHLVALVRNAIETLPPG
jgi:hypothetical protein